MHHASPRSRLGIGGKPLRRAELFVYRLPDRRITMPTPPAPPLSDATSITGSSKAWADAGFLFKRTSESRLSRLSNGDAESAESSPAAGSSADSKTRSTSMRASTGRRLFGYALTHETKPPRLLAQPPHPSRCPSQGQSVAARQRSGGLDKRASWAQPCGQQYV